MPVINNRIKRFRGDTYPLVVTIKENGSAVNLTGSTVDLTINHDTPAKCTADLTDAANGVVTFNFDQSHIGVAGIFKYDIQVTNGTLVTTYVKDVFELEEDVTV